MNFALLASLLSVVLAHDGHDHQTQIPLDYVKFPLEGAYHTRTGEGKGPSMTMCNVTEPMVGQ